MEALMFQRNNALSGSEEYEQSLLALRFTDDKQLELVTAERTTAAGVIPPLEWSVIAATPWTDDLEMPKPLQFFIPLPDCFPFEFSDAVNQQVSRRNIEGYTCLGKMRVNAETGQLIEEEENNPSFILNWMLTPAIDEDGTQARKGVIRGVMAVAAHADKLDFKHGKARPDDIQTDATGMLPNILMDTGHFQLVVTAQPLENSIHPTTLEGAGEILPSHGFKPVLMLALLQRKFKELQQSATGSNESSPLDFCDAQGQTVRLDTWEQIAGVLSKMGFDPDRIRPYAESVDLVAKRYDLAELDIAGMPDAYF